MIKEVCLDDKNTETYEEVICQTFHVDLYRGYLFSDYVLANFELPWLIFLRFKKDALIVDLVIFT